MLQAVLAVHARALSCCTLKCAAMDVQRAAMYKHRAAVHVHHAAVSNVLIGMLVYRQQRAVHANCLVDESLL